MYKGCVIGNAALNEEFGCMKRKIGEIQKDLQEMSEEASKIHDMITAYKLENLKHQKIHESTTAVVGAHKQTLCEEDKAIAFPSLQTESYDDEKSHAIFCARQRKLRIDKAIKLIAEKPYMADPDMFSKKSFVDFDL